MHAFAQGPLCWLPGWVVGRGQWRCWLWGWGGYWGVLPLLLLLLHRCFSHLQPQATTNDGNNACLFLAAVGLVKKKEPDFTAVPVPQEQSQTERESRRRGNDLRFLFPAVCFLPTRRAQVLHSWALKAKTQGSAPPPTHTHSAAL